MNGKGVFTSNLRVSNKERVNQRLQIQDSTQATVIWSPLIFSSFMFAKHPSDEALTDAVLQTTAHIHIKNEKKWYLVVIFLARQGMLE